MEIGELSHYVLLFSIEIWKTKNVIKIVLLWGNQIADVNKKKGNI